MIRGSKRIFAVIAVAGIMAFSQAACTDKDLEKVSIALVDIARGVGTLQTIAIEANTQGLLDPELTRATLGLALDVNEAGKAATEFTRRLSKLKTGDKAQILSILNPIIMEVHSALNSGVFHVKNDTSRQRIETVLIGIETSLNAIQLIIAGSK